MSILFIALHTNFHNKGPTNFVGSSAGSAWKPEATTHDLKYEEQLGLKRVSSSMDGWESWESHGTSPYFSQQAMFDYWRQGHLIPRFQGNSHSLGVQISLKSIHWIIGGFRGSVWEDDPQWLTLFKLQNKATGDLWACAHTLCLRGWCFHLFSEWWQSTRSFGCREVVPLMAKSARASRQRYMPRRNWPCVC